MNNEFLQMPQDMQRKILLAATSQANLPAYILEKDIWLCWVLQHLFLLPTTMAFKGGTSLSKVYGLIERFSEDVDITLDYTNFSVAADYIKSASKTALKKLSDQLKCSLKIYVYETVLPHMQHVIANNFDINSFKLELNEDGEQFRIYYPTLFQSMDGYVSNSILIEFGARNTTEPYEHHTVKTTLSQIASEINLPTANVKVLSPLRTFWEKATLMHVECNRGRLELSPERLSRHWYDLAMLAQSPIGEKALKSKHILNSVLEHKKAFYNASYAKYDDCTNGNFKLIPDQNGVQGLKNDFSKMVNNAMFINEDPSFEWIIKIIHALENDINN